MKLFENYTKQYKHSKVIDLVPLSEDTKICSGNPHLWNGQFLLLSELFKNDIIYPEFIAYHRMCELDRGLFSRFPEELTSTPGYEYDAISFDELNGISFSNIALCRRICEYGEKNSWIFNDRLPLSKPSFTLKDYLAVPKVLVEIIKKTIETKKFGGSGVIDEIIFKSKVLTHYSRMMQPRHIFTWKALAYNETSFLELLHFCLNVLNTIKSEKTSGKNMHLFIFLKLHLTNSYLLDNFMVKYVMKKFLKEVDHLGNAKKFYPENHPIIEAIDRASIILKGKYSNG